jgi:tellurite resistance protein TerC
MPAYINIMVFLGVILGFTFLELRAHKNDTVIPFNDAHKWFWIWVAASMGFAGYVWMSLGAESASLFVTGYLLEKSLALDNLFAFLPIMASFGLLVAERSGLQHRILYWGIIGAIIFRVIFLFAGAFIVNVADWMLVIFALFIFYTAYTMLGGDDEEEDIDYSKHWSVRWASKVFKVTPSIESGKFFDAGKATPLFLCLICIEVCDIMFSFDSMPVIIAVVRDPFLMITSSLLAVCGLRSMYFMIIALKDKFHLLDKAIIGLLVFIGFKLIGAGTGYYHIPNMVSLSIVGMAIVGGIVASVVFPSKEDEVV